jgi:transcription initiation factor IIE alpha subunit
MSCCASCHSLLYYLVLSKKIEKLMEKWKKYKEEGGRDQKLERNIQIKIGQN